MKNVDGCHACETCFKTGKACSFDDDFNAIAPAIMEADVVLYDDHLMQNREGEQSNER